MTTPTNDLRQHLRDATIAALDRDPCWQHWAISGRFYRIENGAIVDSGYKVAIAAGARVEIPRGTDMRELNVEWMR